MSARVGVRRVAGLHDSPAFLVQLPGIAIHLNIYTRAPRPLARWWTHRGYGKGERGDIWRSVVMATPLGALSLMWRTPWMDGRWR